MITKTQIEQQKHAIEGLYEKVMEAPDSERKTQAVAYCEGCIAACTLALQVMNGTTPSAEIAKADESAEVKADESAEVKVVETVEVEEKPKRKSSKKKKEEPVEVVEPEIEEEDDDLDDLL